MAARTVDRYTLHGVLASGGMATVHFGRLRGPVQFTRTVAIKRLLPQFASDAEFVVMFVDEARLASRIRHPNVVPTLDVVTEGGEIFIVMEYVHGESLARLLRMCSEKNVRVPPRIACAIVRDMLSGLQAAHEAKDERGVELGIVHRDVSPQNALVGADGVTRLLDFGIAKARGRSQVTREGQVKGKLAYMAPEQLLGQPITRGTDIFAAAVVLWETLVGRRLFQAESEGHVVQRIVSEDAPPPSRFAPELGDRFDAIVAKGLARDPRERFASARDFAQALTRVEPAADPMEVGEWVSRTASAALAWRTARLREVEEDATRTDAAGTRVMPEETTRIEPPVTPAETEPTLSSATTDRAAPPTAPRIARTAGAVVAVVAITAAGVAFATRTRPRAETPAAQATTSETATAAPTSTAVTTAVATATPPIALTTSAASSPSAPSASRGDGALDGSAIRHDARPTTRPPRPKASAPFIPDRL